MCQPSLQLAKLGGPSNRLCGKPLKSDPLIISQVHERIHLEQCTSGASSFFFKAQQTSLTVSPFCIGSDCESDSSISVDSLTNGSTSDSSSSSSCISPRAQLDESLTNGKSNKSKDKRRVCCFLDECASPFTSAFVKRVVKQSATKAQLVHLDAESNEESEIASTNLTNNRSPTSSPFSSFEFVANVALQSKKATTKTEEMRVSCQNPVKPSQIDKQLLSITPPVRSSSLLSGNNDQGSDQAKNGPETSERPTRHEAAASAKSNSNMDVQTAQHLKQQMQPVSCQPSPTPSPPPPPIRPPLQGLLKKTQKPEPGTDSSQRKRRVRFADTMMVFCDDWPEELMPQIIALKSPSDFNLVEIAAQGYMFEPPAEYKDMLPFDPPPDYRDCVNNLNDPLQLGELTLSNLPNHALLQMYEREAPLDQMVCRPTNTDQPPSNSKLLDSNASYASNGQFGLYRDMILSGSDEMLEEDAIIGVLKEDDILQAIGSQSHIDFDHLQQQQNNLISNNPQQTSLALRHHSKDPSALMQEALSQETLSQGTLSQTIATDQSPTGSLQDLASESSMSRKAKI